MKIEKKFLIDMQTYMAYPELLDNSKNTVFLTPYAEYSAFFEATQKTLDDKKVSKKEKEVILETYVPFIELVASNPEITKQILEDGVMESDYICVNRLNNVFFGFTNYYEENKHNLPQEVVDSDFDFNIINSSIDLDCPIFTINPDLIFLLKKYQLPVKYVTVPIDEIK